MFVRSCKDEMFFIFKLLSVCITIYIVFLCTNFTNINRWPWERLPCNHVITVIKWSLYHMPWHWACGSSGPGASRFENLLAPQKTYWPPKKLTGPYLKTKLARRKTICINLQFAHRPIIKLFRSHPRNNFQIWMVILKKKKKKKKKKKSTGPAGQ